MSENVENTENTKVETTAQKARKAGAKVPTQDHKKAASAKLKALRKEAAEGDVVVEHKGHFYTLRVGAFQERMVEDYEFMEAVTSGILPAMIRELLSAEDQAALKDLVRNPDTNRVPVEPLAEEFGVLMEAGGLGN